MAGKIIADIIEAPYDSIRMNVGNVTVLTANNSGLTYTPTGNVNINVGSTVSLTLGNVTVSSNISTGNISASGVIIPNNGIRFPGTQVSSGDANTLDDYEEGTWTPVITFGGASAGVTYNARRVGVYTKIGNMVVINCFLAPTAVGSSTGDCSITGLPFQAAPTGQAGTGGLMINGVTNDGNTVATIDTNAIVVDFYTTATNGTRRKLNKNDVTNNDEFAFTIVYFV